MYDFKKTEEKILNFWKNNNIYQKAKERNKGKKKFYFLQGPPYTSGRIHIGHAWNNALKDIILRYKRMRGFDVWDRAGYDMHGLPTENKVQANLKLKHKEDIIKFGVDKFIKECIKFSTENAKQMDKDLFRLGVWMDYENAYYPIKNEFIEGEWWFVKKAFENGRLYKGKKIMHWCSSCETALAKHELEYETVKEESIFLKFKVKGENNVYLIIWTTTPWTIPFNLAVMVNPELDYVKAKVGDEVWIIAKGLAASVIGSLANKELVILEEFKGKDLEGMRYEHPFYEELKEQFNEIARKSKNLHTVVLSKEYVTLEAGSGLVHCAPGCGPEDYEVGKKYGLPPFNNIDERGAFFDMGKFNGLVAKKDDKIFVEELRKKGSLIDVSIVEHEYAHCWRCHNPVVFRATEQWFLKIEDLIPKMIELAKDIKFVPKHYKAIFDSWINSLRDNSITRQRFWGTPVPIWECEKCGKYTVIGSIEELENLAVDKNKIPETMHRPWIDEVEIKCQCGGKAKRISDVIDVWIDSGTTSWNCIYFPKRKDLFKAMFPAEFILEATEQIRLWFSMLHLCSTIAFEKPCYRNVYVHGMILDYQGMKMSKSLGNIIPPFEVIEKYGADVLRYYVCGTRAGENINFNWDDVKVRQKNLFIFWNLHKLLIQLYDEIKKKPEEIEGKLDIEEKYIISKLHSTIKRTTELLENYRIDESIDKIEELFLTLSREYVQFVREKMIEEEGKEIVFKTIYDVFYNCLRMFAIIAPFICEEIYQNLKEKFKQKEESVHLLEWPEYDPKLIDEKLERDMKVVSQVIQSILAAREKARIGVRWPLKEAVVITHKKEVIDAVENLKNLILSQVNVKELIVKEELKYENSEIKPNVAEIGKDFKSDAPKILEQLDENKLIEILETGKTKIGDFVLERKHVLIKHILPKNLISEEFKYGYVYINTEITKELEEEGFFREVTRRIQVLRKKNGLKKNEKIRLSIFSDYSLERFGEEIKKKVNAETIVFRKENYKIKSEELIKGKKFEISFEKI